MTKVHDQENLASARLAAIIESSDDAIISKDTNGIITSWNGGAERIFGYSADEVIGKPVTILIPNERLSEEPNILDKIRHGERVEHYETVRKHKDGHLVDISLTVSPILNSSSAVVGASKIARDITARKRNENEMEKLAAIVESSSDAIIAKDLNGIITGWNSGAERIFGYSASEVIGMPVTLLIPPERIEEESGILSRVRAGEDVDHYETVRCRKDGKLIDISLNVSPIRDSNGVIIGASKIARDITEHNKLAAAEHEAQVMHRLVEAQEDERNRLARDLHDHIGQQMTALRLQVERLGSMVEGNDPAARKVNELRDLAAKMDNDVSFLSWELRPIELEELGLVNALKSFARDWSRQYGIETDFHAATSDSNPRLSSDLETSLYRITQEAFNNILKHAAAKNVNVMFHESGTGVSLIIEDDGKGFYPNIVLNRPGARCLGLTGMKERTEMCGGFFNIESIPGSGTTVFCRIPLKPAIKSKKAKNGA